ncbi:MAG: coproporphyrinogen III oxidase family protein, partial [Meiothermus sp.]|nr:coproporphyrinogen III oxidase family protein [Meiothermus sp.]
EISPLEHAKEALMLGLRLGKGVDVREIERRTGLELWLSLEPTLSRLVSQGRLKVIGQRLRAPDLNTLHHLVLQIWDALETTASTRTPG